MAWGGRWRGGGGAPLAMAAKAKRSYSRSLHHAHALGPIMSQLRRCGGKASERESGRERKNKDSREKREHQDVAASRLVRPKELYYEISKVLGGYGEGGDVCVLQDADEVPVHNP